MTVEQKLPVLTLEMYNEILAGAWRKQAGECTPQELQIVMRERELCKTDLVRFLKYVKILVPPTQTNPGGSVDFEMWKHVKLMLKAFLTEKLVVVLKSRQIGASWTVAVFVLWCALGKEGDTTLLFSKGKTEAAELLAKCKRVYMGLPPFLKTKMDPDSATEIGFPKMKSSIKAFAATETAGISFTASRIVADEWIEHPFAEENYMASKPCVDAGGQFIGIFTTNKEKLSSLPVGIFKGALKGSNGFRPLFFPWTAVPGRTEEWYKKTKDSIPSDEIGTLTPDMYMAWNYPSTMEEALAPSQTIAAFDMESLKWMMGECKNPIQIPELDNKIAHVYKPYSLGQYFVAATDTSHGVGKDYSVTVVLNVKTGEVVADVFSNIVSEEELASQSVALLKLYGSPLWFIEDNDWGRSTILAAERAGYKNFGYQDKDRKKIGYKTVGGDTGRNALWGSLIPAINNKQIVVYNKEGLLQFYDVIRNAEKNGRIEAMQNRHDDYPMALAIAWYKKDEVYTGEYNSKPINSLHFNRRLFKRK